MQLKSTVAHRNDKLTSYKSVGSTYCLVYHRVILSTLAIKHTMKRSLNEALTPSLWKNSLGASEFAAALNGDDPKLLLQLLKRFTKVVQRERRLALGDEDFSHDEMEDDSDKNDSDDNDTDSDNNDNDAASSSTKKLKWMQDSQNYNVPFIGTAVAKGNLGTVIQHQWPCGLLHAYLAQSTMAIEFTSDQLTPPNGHVHKRLLRNKQGATSQAIYKAYLNALTELLSAAVPIHILCRGISNNYTPQQTNPTNVKFLPNIIKDRLPTFLTLLNQETGNGKGKSDSHMNVGPLAAPLLKIMSQISSISVGNARDMARDLDTSLREGVVRMLLSRPPPKQLHTATNEKVLPNEKTTAMIYNTRAACLRLASALTEWNDPTTTSYVATSGSRERKIQPGVLFLCVRYGLVDSLLHGSGEKMDDFHEVYLIEVGRLLNAIRGLLPSQRQEKKDDTLTRRALADLLAAEALQNISKITSCAPKLVHYEAVLMAKDECIENASRLEIVGMQARRLLFPILADSARSPFLSRITRKAEDKTSTIYSQYIVKAMNELLTKQGSIPMQKFLVHILSSTPLLAHNFLRSLSVPDCKVVFGFISQIGFIGRVLKDGPSVVSCLVEPSNIDHILSILVLPCFKKQAMTKALQSTNPLVVCEVLKMTIILLQRFGSHFNKNPCNSSVLMDAFSKRLIDLPTLLIVRAKFDPFKESSKVNDVVTGMLCQCLVTFSTILPAVCAKFDWTKLLPDKSCAFCNVPPLVQLQTLKAIESRSSKKISSIGLGLVLDIMIATKQCKVYEKIRSIAVQALRALVLTENVLEVVKDSLLFEIELWIDSLTATTVKEFVSCCSGPDATTFQHTILVAQAWKESGVSGPMGTLMHSSILTAALHKLSKSSMQEEIARIAGRCLLYHNNPLPLASFIVAAVGRVEKSSIQLLCDYSKSLLSYDIGKMGPAMNKLLPNLLSPAYYELSEDHIFKVIPSTFENATEIQLIEAIRVCLHALMVKTDSQSQEVLHKGLQSLLLLFSQSKAEAWTVKAILEHPLFHADSGLSAKKTLYYLLLFSQRPEILIDISPRSVALFDYQQISDLKMDKITCTQLLRLWLIMPFCPGIYFSEIITRLLQLDFNEGSVTILNSFILNWIRESEQPSGSSQRIGFNSIIRATNQEYISPEVIVELEARLANTYRHEDQYADFCAESPNVILSTCLQSLIIQDQKKVPTTISPSMLSVVLAYDPCRFLPIFSKILNCDFNCSDLNFDQLQQHIAAGTFDDSLLSLTKYYSCFGASHLEKRMEVLILSRAVTICTKSEVDAEVTLAISMFLTFIASADEQKCIDIFDAIVQRVEAPHIQSRMYAHLVTCLPKVIQVIPYVPLRDKLASDFLSQCVGTIPVLLKRHYRNAVWLSTSATNITELLNATIAIVDLIPDTLLVGIVSQLPPSSVDNCVRACMKYCIQQEYSNELDLAVGCIALLQTLLKLRVSTKEFTHGISKTSELLHPHILLHMIVSHSKFSELLKSEDSIYTAIKLPLFQIMQSCISNVGLNAPFDKAEWATLMSSYTASMSEQDCTLRRILFAAAECRDGYVPNLNEMHWKGSSFGSGNAVSVKIDGDWQWLVDSLDTVRIHTTLHQFPIHDSISSEGSQRHSEVDFDEADAKGDVNDEENGNSILPDGDPEIVENRESSRKWQGRGADVRYSPAFIIPLILGALESRWSESPNQKPDIRSAGDSMCNSSLVYENNEGNEEAFVVLSQRLCDKGALALSIASLSSRCPMVREIAMSTLGLFMLATNSKTARDLTTWRSRPQIAVLLNSLQRGMAIRRAIFPSKCPRLPVVSAIFLAKASFIINKPGDPMFGPINKYFLKIDEGYGAYNDFNRLPGFIPFFCSSADEGDQAKRDRIWALQFLKDAFVDSSCYRMISSCHAPELILTTLQGLSARSDEDVDLERILLLETVTRLVQHGERAAGSHFIERLGLLSWLASFLGSDNVTVVLPTSDSRRAYLELVLVTIQEVNASLTRQLTEQETSEFSFLLQPILSVFATIEESSDRAIKDLACKVVHTLISQMGSIEERFASISTINGIHVASALHTLLMSPNEWKPRMAWAICCIGMDEISELDALNLMSSLLDVIPLIVVQDHIVPLLARIKQLAQVDVTVTQPVLVEKLLAGRQVCFGSPRTRQAWIDCLGMFLIGDLSTSDICKVRDAHALYNALG